MKLYPVALAVGLSSLLAFSADAFAQSCNNLQSNIVWTDNYSAMESAYDKKNYDEAIEYSKKLFAICPKSPALNYYTGMSFLNKGEKERAKIYLTKASDYTSEIAVSEGMGRRIWYARYEIEHPEATSEAIKARDEEIKEAQAQHDKYDEEMRKHADDMEVALHRQSTIDQHEYEAALTQYRAVMYTGIGLTAAGAIMAITGGVMAGLVDRVEGDINLDSLQKQKGNSGYKITNSYTASWAILGAGVALTAGGIALASVAGYKLSNHKKNKPAGVSAAFSISPTTVSFDLTF